MLKKGRYIMEDFDKMNQASEAEQNTNPAVNPAKPAESASQTTETAENAAAHTTNADIHIQADNAAEVVSNGAETSQEQHESKAAPHYTAPENPHTQNTGYTPLNNFSNVNAGPANFSGTANKQNTSGTGAQGGSFARGANGEYRYAPPFAGSNVPPQGKRNKKEKKKTNLTAGTAAVVAAACILISFGAGMGGAAIVGGGTSHSGSVSNSGDMVIYKSAVISDSDGNSLEGQELTASQVCDIVSGSVVEITTEFLSSYGNFQYVSSGAGSGVIISTDGYIVTNNHVISGTSSSGTSSVANSIKVRLNDETEYEATVIGADSESDIALLKIDASDLTCAVVGDSSGISTGDQVLAVGNPLGQLGGTVTSGIISSTDREIPVDGKNMTLIQIDAAINPGNSGGGLFNMRGELIGIVNAKSTGTSIEGLGFAIPVNKAVSVVEELKTRGYVSGKTYIGISLYDATDAFSAYRYFGSQATGVYVAKVEEGYNTGVLEYGDRIIAVDGKEITSSSDVKSAVSGHSVGDTMTFSLYRGGKLTEVTVTCYEYVPQSSVSFTTNNSGASSSDGNM